MLQLFWLLLPLAALSGWSIGRWGHWRNQRAVSTDLPKNYLLGLNHLLNEEQDKAIEVFTRMVEVDSNTAELHLALGHLFRSRGEVDRAIRIHQNLIARPAMTREQRAHALLELGLDYMKAGLLDRAEALFEQVLDVDTYAVPALKQLLVIHQQAKEWQEAISVALQLDVKGVAGMRLLIAHFYCEQADLALADGDQQRAIQLFKRALVTDHSCVRANIHLARLRLESGNHRAALRAYLRVERQDPEFMPEVLGPIQECYRQLGQPEAMMRELETLAEKHGTIDISVALADAISEQRGLQEAIVYLFAALDRMPSLTGLLKLVSLMMQVSSSDERVDDLEKVRQTVVDLLAQYNTYECRRCGFVGRNLYWHCPSCRSWGTVKPLVI